MRVPYESDGTRTTALLDSNETQTKALQEIEQRSELTQMPVLPAWTVGIRRNRKMKKHMRAAVKQIAARLVDDEKMMNEATRNDLNEKSRKQKYSIHPTLSGKMF